MHKLELFNRLIRDNRRGRDGYPKSVSWSGLNRRPVGCLRRGLRITDIADEVGMIRTSGVEAPLHDGVPTLPAFQIRSPPRIRNRHRGAAMRSFDQQKARRQTYCITSSGTYFRLVRWYALRISMIEWIFVVDVITNIDDVSIRLLLKDFYVNRI